MTSQHVVLQDYQGYMEGKGFFGVKEIVLNRPERKNALNLDMWKEFTEAVVQCHADESVRLIVIRGVNETAFAAGADISEFPDNRHDAKSFKEYDAITDRATRVLRDARPITVASIRGVCYGGGMQIASACDVRVCDEDARFAITPGRLGFIYGAYETRLLVNIIGEAAAKDLLLSGREWNAVEAMRFGFVVNAYAHADYDLSLNHLLRQYTLSSPSAQQGMKEIIHLVSSGQSDDTEYTESLVLASIDGADYHEGVTSFLNKRKPVFQLENTLSPKS